MCGNVYFFMHVFQYIKLLCRVLHAMCVYMYVHGSLLPACKPNSDVV